MAKQAKLNVANLRKEDKKLFGNTKTVTIDGYTLEIDTVFRESKIKELVHELVSAGDKFKKGGASLDAILSPYATLLTIKHFTSLDIPNDMNGQLQVMTLLLDLKIFDKIIEEMPEDELQKISSHIIEVAQTAMETLDEFDQQSLLLDIENEEVAKLLLNKGDENANVQQSG